MRTLRIQLHFITTEFVILNSYCEKYKKNVYYFLILYKSHLISWRGKEITVAFA